MAQAVTVYPVYNGDQYSQLSNLVYVADWKGLVDLKDLKGYKVHHKGTHYYNLQYHQLVDFDYKMEVEEAGLRALRGLADALENDNELNLRHIKQGLTRSRRIE